MRTLSLGFHQFDLPRLYDPATDAVSSTRIFVGFAPMPEATKDYFVDFTYSVPNGICAGAAALGKFECTEGAIQAATAALGQAGLGTDTVLDAQILYCKSACYHEDGAFNTIFGTFHWHGAPGDVVFPRLDVRVHMTPGAFVLFDCHEPHSFLRESGRDWHPEDYEDAEYTHFVSLDLDRLHNEVDEVFDLSAARDRAARRDYLSLSGKGVCQHTGAWL